MRAGRAWPLGASLDGDGVNFALFSAHAEAVELCLYAPDGRTETARHRLGTCTDQVWHGFVPGLAPGQAYGYRVYGPYDPAAGHRFNPQKLLLDPYARAWLGDLRWADPAAGHGLGAPGQEAPFDDRDNGAAMAKALVTGPDGFDWGEDRPPNTPMAESVIYELHVKGFTQLLESVPQPWRGRFLGLASDPALDHLKRLGITAVELLPIQAFLDEPFARARGLVNYWGYNTLGFFMPDARYAVSDGAREFKTLVKRLHAAGIEVILDVVYNHTAEGDQAGPILSFRGIDNASYYRLEPGRPALYDNPTGTGNALDLSHPRVLQLVMDSLRYWVEEYHVDGFRFDLATVLARGPNGFEPTGPFLAAMRQDPVLARVKLIAEPWDIGLGGYQLGQFPPGWGEWNDRFRDDVRQFWLPQSLGRGALAHRLAGSSDLFQRNGRQPAASVNFITAHDGFTLTDLVTYTQKHNAANGEDNRDGTDHNLGSNAGVEGPSADPAILARRNRLKRAMLGTLLLSLGVPMLNMGDEIGHSQGGNNNVWCQDNPTAWLDWSAADADLADHVAGLIRLRRRLGAQGWWQAADALWLDRGGSALTPSQWDDGSDRCFTLHLPKLAQGGAAMLINGADEAIDFALPPGLWRHGADEPICGRLRVDPLSIIVLLAANT